MRRLPRDPPPSTLDIDVDVAVDVDIGLELVGVVVHSEQSEAVFSASRIQDSVAVTQVGGNNRSSGQLTACEVT